MTKLPSRCDTRQKPPSGLHWSAGGNSGLCAFPGWMQQANLSINTKSRQTATTIALNMSRKGLVWPPIIIFSQKPERPRRHVWVSVRETHANEGPASYTQPTGLMDRDCAAENPIVRLQPELRKENPFSAMIFTEERLREAALTLKQTHWGGRVIKLLCSPQRSSSYVWIQTWPRSCFGSNHVGLICKGTSGIDSQGLVLMSR